MRIDGFFKNFFTKSKISKYKETVLFIENFVHFHTELSL